MHLIVKTFKSLTIIKLKMCFLATLFDVWCVNTEDCTTLHSSKLTALINNETVNF